MGNQRNARKRIPTAKKLADDKDDSHPSHRPSTRPKPRPTGKAAQAIKNPKPSRTEAMGTEESNYQARTSETFDTSMISCDAEEGEVIEEEEDDTMDDIYEDEDDEEVETVTEVKRRKATAPLAGV